jgi:hypothetical protein
MLKPTNRERPMADAIDAEVLEVYFLWLKIYADKHYCQEDLLARIAPGSILRVGHSRDGGVNHESAIALLHYRPGTRGTVPRVTFSISSSLLTIPRTVFGDYADQICSRRR